MTNSQCLSSRRLPRSKSRKNDTNRIICVVKYGHELPSRWARSHTPRISVPKTCLSSTTSDGPRLFPWRERSGARSLLTPSVPWIFNPSTAKFFNFHSLEVVSRWRDAQLQVSENYSYLTKWRLIIFKSCWFSSHFMFNTFKMWYLIW